MHIELLWIIPVFAFGFFIFLIAFFAQRRSESGQDLSSEVLRYNSGMSTGVPAFSKIPESRLGDIESAISMVTQSLSDQQRIVDRFKMENTSYVGEISGLKQRLRELNKEHDIIMSENYSLRAKFKKLLEKADPLHTDQDLHSLRAQVASLPTSPGKLNMRLYEDTRLMTVSSLDDTAEIDLADLR